jgi:hypothetical protein
MSSTGSGGAPCSSGGSALSFDGVDDHFSIARIVQDSFTIEAWIKTSTPSRTGTFFYEGTQLIWADVPGMAEDFAVAILNNDLTFGVGNGTGVNDSQIQSFDSVTTGEWTHVAVVRNESGKTISLFVNGMQESSKGSANTNPLNSPMQITIGGVLNNYQGIMDEVRFWNIARSEADIQSTMNVELKGNETGLVAYYKFDEGSGSTVKDSTASANSATLGDGMPSAAPAWVTTGAPICPAP